MVIYVRGQRLSHPIISDRLLNLCRTCDCSDQVGHIVLYLCVIVGTLSLIRPLVPWLAAVPSKHNSPSYYIYLSSTWPIHGESPGSHSQAVWDHERLGPFVHRNICTLAACDKVWCCDSPQNRSIFFLSHLPAWTLCALFPCPFFFCLSSHLGGLYIKHSSPALLEITQHFSHFFPLTNFIYSLWFCRLLLLPLCFYTLIHSWSSRLDIPISSIQVCLFF